MRLTEAQQGKMNRTEKNRNRIDTIAFVLIKAHLYENYSTISNADKNNHGILQIYLVKMEL